MFSTAYWISEVFLDKYEILLYLKKHQIFKNVFHNFLQIFAKKSLGSLLFSRDFFGLTEMC